MTAKHAKKFSKATYKPFAPLGALLHCCFCGYTPIAPLALWRVRTRLPYLELEFSKKVKVPAAIWRWNIFAGVQE